MSNSKTEGRLLSEEDIKPIDPDDPILKAGYLIGGRKLSNAAVSGKDKPDSKEQAALKTPMDQKT